MVRRKPSPAPEEHQQQQQQQRRRQAGSPSGVSKGKAGASDTLGVDEGDLAGLGDSLGAPGGPGLSAAEQQRLDRISLALETRLAALLGDEDDGGGDGASAAAAAVAVGHLQLGELEEWWDGEEEEEAAQEGGAEGAKEAQRAQQQQQQVEQQAASGRGGKRGRWVVVNITGQ